MVLVDEKPLEYEPMLQHYQTKQDLTWKRPTEQTVKSSTIKQMKSSIDDPAIPEDVKAKHYGQNLRRFLHTKPKLAEEPLVDLMPTVDELLDASEQRAGRRPADRLPTDITMRDSLEKNTYRIFQNSVRFRGVASPNTVRFRRGFRRSTRDAEGNPKICVSNPPVERGTRGSSRKSKKVHFPRNDPLCERAPRRASGRQRKGSRPASTPNGILGEARRFRSAAERKSVENGRKSVFGRLFGKTCCDPRRKHVRRTRPEATYKMTQTASF
jgi:hypothetical protein